MIKPEATVA